MGRAREARLLSFNLILQRLSLNYLAPPRLRRLSHMSYVVIIKREIVSTAINADKSIRMRMARR